MISGKDQLRASANPYDWLGHGIYFWENNPQRAMDYAEMVMKYPGRAKRRVKTPFVVGAVIDPGHCLNLLQGDSISLVKQAYELLVMSQEKAGLPLPENKRQEEGVPLLRYLDCAVLEALHTYRETHNESAFDSVRAVFTEGGEIYRSAGFRDKSHIQVCVRNPNCIKGYFHQLDPVSAFRIP